MWQQILRYLFLAKKNPNEVSNTNTKLMHGMNRISIFVFLFAIMVMIYRAFFKH